MGMKVTGKRGLSNSSQEDEVEKRVKVKTTDTDSPARVNKLKLLRGKALLKPSKLTSPTLPLSNLTNSPIKTKTPLKKPDEGVEESVDPEGTGVLTKAGMMLRSRGEKPKRNAEECKQQ